MSNKVSGVKKYFLITAIGLLTFLVLIIGGKAHAATGPNYYISPLPVANQLNKNNNYFYLKVGDKLQQQIQVRVYNQSNKDLKLQQQIINAYTTEKGYVGYNPTLKPIKYDETLKHKLTDFVSLKSPEVFTIKPKSSVVVTADINGNLPTDFTGEVLGSWYFVQYGGNSHKIKSNVVINNEYAYVTSIGLQKGDVILPDMKLTKARAMVSNGNPGAGITIQNPKSGIMSNLKLKTKVIRLKDNKEVLMQGGTQLGMAPNSNFEYFLNAGNKPLTPGKYRAVVDAESGMQHWHLTRDFTVTQAQVKQIKNKTVSYNKVPWAWIIVSGILLIAVLVLLWLLWKKRKQSQASDITNEL